MSLNILSGCAHRWNKKTCAQTNFVDLGYQEGSLGKSSSANDYNQACLKQRIQIPTSNYTSSYKKGLSVFCSNNKGLNGGILGEKIIKNCKTVVNYAKAYKKGLKSFCSTKRGVKDGFAMKPEYVLCASFSAYTIGYTKGKKEYCSSDKGHGHGFTGINEDTQCISYSDYTSGYIRGKRYFCSPENGIKMGKKGESLPKKCISTGSTFKVSFNKGRKIFLIKALKDKETALTFEYQNYEHIRNDLENTQFSLSRLPKQSTDSAIVHKRTRMNLTIASLKSKRDSQKQVVKDLKSQVYNIKKQLNHLKK